MKYVKRVISQSSHRNGVGGAGFVVTLFEAVDNEGVFVAISMRPDRPDEAVPDYAIASYGIRDAYIQHERNDFAAHTAVLNVDETANGNIEFAGGNSWRGDNFGYEIADAWRAQCLADAIPYDPFLERYHDEVDDEQAPPRVTLSDEEQRALDYLSANPLLADLVAAAQARVENQS